MTIVINMGQDAFEKILETMRVLDETGFVYNVQITDVRYVGPVVDDTDETDPPTDTTDTKLVTVVDRHPMRFKVGQDGKNKPILQIYPNEKKELQKQRIIAELGTVYTVYSEIVISTGRERWYKTVNMVGMNGEVLYVDYDKVR